MTLEPSVAVTSSGPTASGAPRFPCAEPAAKPICVPITSVVTIATSVAADGRRRIRMLYLSPNTPRNRVPPWGESHVTAVRAPRSRDESRLSTGGGKPRRVRKRRISDHVNRGFVSIPARRGKSFVGLNEAGCLMPPSEHVEDALPALRSHARRRSVSSRTR